MTNSETAWILKFPSNDAGESEGLGNAAIETFRDRPYASVARECGQNSKDSGAEIPVKLSFDALEVEPESIPSIATLREDVAGCLKAAEAKLDEKEIEFFKQASVTLSGKKIRVLRIADSNTKGLLGPCVEGKPFHSLLKGEGVSVKENADSGGSFGIGKNAVFAVSDLQTSSIQLPTVGTMARLNFWPKARPSLYRTPIKTVIPCGPLDIGAIRRDFCRLQTKAERLNGWSAKKSVLRSLQLASVRFRIGST